MFSLADRRRAAAVFLSLAGVAALSACSDSPDPGANAAQSPTASASETASSPSPSPSPSATYKPASADGPAENVPLPVMPEEAKVESKEGLIAFARHWYDLANYGYETGDVEPLWNISGPDCFACKNYSDSVESGYVRDDWMAGSKITVQGVDSTYARTPEGRVQALVQFIQEPLEFYGPSGLLSTLEGNSVSSVQMVEATYSDGRWTAVDVVTIHEGK
ncbi:DUF6318 family protein [Arthrobacter caoxuetaonis]|uniref:DUF6318 family protein n=1 Tax=Arthrobacter caoxuetaonis TaxID=2886935 RepID=UPI001D13BF94|nr:DUF6318 family protein [Arthrobacter caoxuetaonis]MCC3282229.1 DUF6318 family protein [Arthrobacter caoxuetaonis]